jgi:hypothetical protein
MMLQGSQEAASTEAVLVQGVLPRCERATRHEQPSHTRSRRPATLVYIQYGAQSRPTPKTGVPLSLRDTRHI